MKPHTLPVRRTPVSKGIFKRLSAVTRSRKQRVAATATDEDFEEGDHSSKISRALTIIFLIHIVVIGLIFFHQHYLDDGGSKGQTTATKVAPVVAQAHELTLPKISTGDAIYRAVPGDNYPRIAAQQEVDEAELRAANNNMDIVPGRIMKIPPKHLTALNPPEVDAIRESTPSDRDRGLVEAVPVQTGGAPRARLVRPAIQEDDVKTFPTVAATPAPPKAARPIAPSTKPAPPVAKPVTVAASAPPATAKPGKTTHVVQAGDNLWRIANRYKVDQTALMKANGISDPKKLKLGMTLNIPR